MMHYSPLLPFLKLLIKKEMGNYDGGFMFTS